MPNRSKNILVTGGAGHIGSQVCKAVAQAGDRSQRIRSRLCQ
ncbi:NAD-dependent epimerase/dehydratase family protein [Halochromatium sp.]